MFKKKLAWATAKSIDSAKWVLFGVPDETGSHSYRKGSSKGPDAIRKVSLERDVFIHGKTKSLEQPESGEIKDVLFDYGNVKKENVDVMVKHIISMGKKPIVLGGDHSITFQILKGLNEVVKDFSVVYLDAHPDFICSSHRYYGSVMCDAMNLKNINLSKSVEVGVRAPEKEELINLKQKHLMTITPFEIAEKGIKAVVEKIKKRVGKNVYLSIDVDVLDPAFAPGVSTPVPGGLTSNEFLYLIKELSKLNIIGFDLMEVTPNYDLQNITSHLAARAIAEIISNLGRHKL
jgi:agmatinase